MDDLVVERVLRAVEQIPRGCVASYGQLGDLAGIGPRFVGRVMSLWGSNVTWWRVVNASGDLPAHLLEQAREHWAQEGILVKPNGRGCRIERYRADPQALRTAYQRAVADLPGEGASLRDDD